MPVVGQPNDRGTTLQVIGVDSPGAGLPTIELDNVSRFNEFAIQSAAGSMDVLGSLDGVTFTVPLALEDKQSTTPATRVLATAPGGIFYFSGNYKAIRIRQVGGGAVTGAVLQAGKMGRD